MIFPAGAQPDFPWPAQVLSDRFAGPLWNFLAMRPGESATAAAAHLGSLDSLKLPAYSSLAAIINRVHLYDCDLETHIIVCQRPLRGTVTVDSGRVLLRITDESWLRRLNRQHPDSGWLRVDGPNRSLTWHHRVPIRYVSGPGGA
jgi:hypothetical protein